MSHRRSIVGVVLMAVLAAPGMGAAYDASAAPQLLNAQHADHRADDAHGQQAMRAAEFKVFQRPTRRYTTHTCVIDLSKYDDLSLHSKLHGCGTTIRFSNPFMRMTPPVTWGPWSCPPYSESCTPYVMYSNHVVAATVDFGTTVTTGGFECEPAYPQVERVKISFFTGPKGTGTLVGTITRDVDGHGGARLFAARSKTGFRSAVITNDSDDQFAIAQIRV